MKPPAKCFYAASECSIFPQSQSTLQDRQAVGGVDHLKSFANEEAAEEWFAEHDREAVAFEYPLIGADEE
jgi:hypothetical protein